MREIALPEPLEGSIIVDVGAGASDAVALLRSYGAQAYAVDPRYDAPDFAQLKASFRSQFGFEPEPVNATGISAKIRRWIVKNLGGYSGKSAIAAETMLADAQHSPESYLKAHAHDMPFESESADLVYSLQAVSAFLLDDYGLLRASMKEMLRVTKKGSRIHILPWPNPEGPMDDVLWPPQRFQNATRIQNEISGRVQNLALTQSRYGARFAMSDLVITK